MIRTRLRWPAAVLASALTIASLTGCGGSDDKKKDAGSEPSSEASSAPESSSTPSETPTEPEATTVDFGKPAKGPKIRGNGYRFRVPASWVEDTAGAKELDGDIDTAAWERDGKDGFRNNVAVTYIVASGGDLDGLEESITEQLTAEASKLETLDRVFIDARPATHHRGTMKASPAPYLLDQYAVIDDEGRVTVIGFSYPTTLAAKKRDAITNSILASWKWTS
ncbi:hypothetical protein ACLM5J_20565 [Nocardioides sp. Bht2]|uniref:hypothetical protein n=1 Tax=Nocardioides sp. Bht2 TaxID=3392297 RepID=UPI0039B53B20